MRKNNRWLASTASMMLVFMLASPTYADDLTQLNQQKETLLQEINALKSSGLTITSTQVAVTVLKDNQSETSMMQNYILSPADVEKQEDGSYLVHLTIKDPSYWKSFVVNGNDVVMISDNDNTAVVEFTVDTLTELATVNIHIVVPSINYDHSYVTYLQFNQDDANKLKVSNDSQLKELTEKLERVNQDISEKQSQKIVTKEKSKVESMSLPEPQTSGKRDVTKTPPQSPASRIPLPWFIGGSIIVVVGALAWLTRKNYRK